MVTLLTIFLIYSTPFEEVAQGPTVPGQKTNPAEQPLVLDRGRTIQVSQIVFDGNSAVTSQQLNQIAYPFLNKALSQTDIGELKKRVQLLYQSKGIDDVIVFIPAQQKAPNTLLVKIVEPKTVK